MTLKEIAKEAGVSVSTVSRVINQKGPHVARPELQNRIWEIVSRTGYRPNENALNLKRNTQPGAGQPHCSIACLFARTPESISDPFFSQLARSVEAAAFQAGYRVRYSLTEVDVRQPSLLQDMVDQHVRGVVILGRCDRKLLHLLKQSFHCVSYTGLNPPEAKYDQIICDGQEVSRAAVEYLLSLGHQNVAYIGETDNENRYLGYLQALEEHKIPLRENYVRSVMLSTENGYRGAWELMRRAEGVTAILCANDLTAIGAMRALHEMGVRTPQDLSIMGIDDIDMAQYMSTKLTSVHIPVEEMGQTATKILLDRINGGHSIHMKVSLPFYIVERESCAKPPRIPWCFREKE